MLFFSKLVFTQFFLISFKLCTPKVYFKPDNSFSFDLQNSLEISNSNEDTDLIAVLPNHGNRVDDVDAFLNKVFKYKFIENDESNSDTQVSEESDLEKSDLNLDDDQQNMLRKRWRSSCDKKASKTCTSACKSAYKIVCGSYRCKKRMTRDFKKECKRNCKSKFVASVSSYETSD